MMRGLWRVVVIAIAFLIPLALLVVVGGLANIMRWQLGSPLLPGHNWCRWSHLYLILGSALSLSLYIPVIIGLVKKKQKMLFIPLIAAVVFIPFSILLARISQRVYLTQRIAEMDVKIAQNPADSMAREIKANAYADLGDYDKAIALYNEVLATTATPAYVLHDRGMAYMGKGEYATAIADLTQALQMNANEKKFVAQGHNDRAVVYFRSGQYTQSWQDVEKARELGYEVRPGFLAELEKKRSR
jgi:tetratricopeptide (TPR) repeat protein